MLLTPPLVSESELLTVKGSVVRCALLTVTEFLSETSKCGQDTTGSQVLAIPHWSLLTSETCSFQADDCFVIDVDCPLSRLRCFASSSHRTGCKGMIDHLLFLASSDSSWRTFVVFYSLSKF